MVDRSLILDKKEKENAKAVASYKQCVENLLEKTEKELRSTKK
jgi:hypothetical protein